MSTSTSTEILQDLIERMDDAASVLTELAQANDVGTPERARLSGKADGVRLAASYVAEELR